MVLFSKNELKILKCIKRNVIICAKDIIEQTELSDRAIKRILRKNPLSKKLKLLIIMKNSQIKNINWQNNDRYMAELKIELRFLENKIKKEKYYE